MILVNWFLVYTFGALSFSPAKRFSPSKWLQIHPAKYLLHTPCKMFVASTLQILCSFIPVISYYHSGLQRVHNNVLRSHKFRDPIILFVLDFIIKFTLLHLLHFYFYSTYWSFTGRFSASWVEQTIGRRGRKLHLTFAGTASAS